ncbi:MAG: hypothetical protein OWQ54_02710 [Sulfolobaceae archaeon]|nr:hypothetical protein [Sulfolobaceae archaeon]
MSSEDVIIEKLVSQENLSVIDKVMEIAKLLDKSGILDLTKAVLENEDLKQQILDALLSPEVLGIVGQLASSWKDLSDLLVLLTDQSTVSKLKVLLNALKGIDEKSLKNALNLVQAIGSPGEIKPVKGIGDMYSRFRYNEDVKIGLGVVFAILEQLGKMYKNFSI